MRTFAFFFAFLLAFGLVTAYHDEQDGVARLVARNNTQKPANETKTVNTKMTFYEDGELKNAACYGRDGLPDYDAKPSDFIGAMKMKNQEMCYQCLQIKNKKNNKKVIVKIIDECSTCAPNQVDVTKTVFSKLADPDLGVVKISWKPVSCPSKGSFPTFEEKGEKGKKHN